MITRGDALDLLVLWLNVGLVVVVLAMVACVVLAVVLLRGRRKSYEEYQARREGYSKQVQQGACINPSPTYPKPPAPPAPPAARKVHNP